MHLVDGCVKLSLFTFRTQYNAQDDAKENGTVEDKNKQTKNNWKAVEGMRSMLT